MLMRASDNMFSVAFLPRSSAEEVQMHMATDSVTAAVSPEKASSLRLTTIMAVECAFWMADIASRKLWKRLVF